ncbi:MAG: ABC transporter permease [Ignavibacteria bacterium]|jgi:cell division transport system permease protein|nr:ABC transporter permease [Ignavibacteria bacterium]
MKIRYIYNEALRGFSTAKLSTLASMFTISISLILMSIYFLFTINSNKLIKSIKDKVEIEVFLTDDVRPDELLALKDKIKAIGGVKGIIYISEEDAAKIFEAEFGKEMLEIYEYNPLPASIRISLYDEYKTTERIKKIKSQIETNPLVQDIVFPEKNLEIIEQKTSGFLFVNLIVMIIITLSSVFLVSNTIRLIINSRQRTIDIFKLLGATKTFTMLPYLTEGFIQGLLGSLFAVAMMLILTTAASSKFANIDFKIDLISNDIILYMFFIGIFLGLSGSYFSVKKYLKFNY